MLCSQIVRWRRCGLKTGLLSPFSYNVSFSKHLTTDAKVEMLYISTSLWVLDTQNAGRNSHFQHFLWQKA